MTDKKEARKYWGIIDEDGVTVFQGTFKECWAEFVSMYSGNTVKWLNEQGIKITRVQ